MSDPPRHTWHCPSCGRHIPRHVDVCRCGSERRRLEALGYTFDTPPPPAPAISHRQPAAEYHGPAAMLIGYRIDTDLAVGWRAALALVFAASVAGTGAATVHLTHTDPIPSRENVQVLSTLDEFTRSADPGTGNTIPPFLSSPGIAGVLTASGAPDDLVRAIDETELRAGFCSQNTAKLVRHEYPGYYEQWPDDKLVRTVLKKHPDYTDRLCSLSIRLDATAADIVKYELKPRSLVSTAGLWSRTVLITAVFALACLNVYYRVIIGRLVSR